MRNITGSCFSFTYSFMLFPTESYFLPASWDTRCLSASIPQVLNLPLFSEKSRRNVWGHRKICCFSAQSSTVLAGMAAAPHYGVWVSCWSTQGAGCSHAAGSPHFQLLKCIKRSQDWNWTPRLFSFSNYHHFQGDVAHGKEEAKTLTQGKGSVQWVLAVKMRSMLFLPLSSIFPILLLFGEGGGLTSTLLQDWSSK